MGLFKRLKELRLVVMKQLCQCLVMVPLLLLMVHPVIASELVPVAAFTDAPTIKFLGRLHVLVLHFPIAILLLAFFSSFLRLCRIRLFDDKAQLGLLLFGSLSALVTVAFGLILAQEDDPTDAIRWHMYTGIAAFATSLMALFTFKAGLVKKSAANTTMYAGSAILCTVCLFWSGHLGGELSHGKKFFSEYAPWTEPRKPKEKKPVDEPETDTAQMETAQLNNANEDGQKTAATEPAQGQDNEPTDDANDDMNASVDPMMSTDNSEKASEDDMAPAATQTPALSKAAKENAELFVKHVEPILAARCYECHGASKQKSDLRLDSPEFIRIGGNGGEVVVSGQPERSTLYTLAVLDEDDPDIMPPKGKPLSKKQLEVIHKWIVGGAFYGDEAQRKQAPKQKKDTRVSKLEKESSGIAKPLDKILKSIRDTGVHVNPLTSNGALLELDMRFHKKPLSSYPTMLKDIQQNVRWLDIGRTAANDQVMAEIAKFNKLQRLYLHETKIGDAGMAHIAKLKDLEVLNLYKCNVTDAGIKQLHGLKNLKKVYVWQTKVTPAGIKALQKALPKLDINTGK